MPVAHHIGLEIAEREIRLAEIRFMDGYPIVLRCDTIESSECFGSPLLHDVPYSRSLAKAFISDIARVLHSRPLFASDVSFVLPASMPVLDTIPIDPTLGAEESGRQIEWMCNVLGDRPAGTFYQIFTQEISRRENKKYALVAAIPQETIKFVKSVCRHLTMEAQAIEIDHFLFESVMCGNNSGKAEFQAVLGLSPRICSASVTDGNRYAGFRKRAVERNVTPSRAALMLLRELLETGPITVNGAGLYGPAADERALRELRELLAIPVRILQPLDRLNFLSGHTAEQAGRRPPHTYSAALYAALKNGPCV